MQPKAAQAATGEQAKASAAKAAAQIKQKRANMKGVILTRAQRAVCCWFDYSCMRSARDCCSIIVLEQPRY